MYSCTLQEVRQGVTYQLRAHPLVPWWTHLRYFWQFFFPLHLFLFPQCPSSRTYRMPLFTLFVLKETCSCLSIISNFKDACFCFHSISSKRNVLWLVPIVEGTCSYLNSIHRQGHMLLFKHYPSSRTHAFVYTLSIFVDIMLLRAQYPSWRTHVLVHTVIILNDTCSFFKWYRFARTHVLYTLASLPYFENQEPI